jgi:sigma54-dependent transcription regulator
MRSKTHVQLMGRSAAMIALQEEVDRVARSDAKVLITGESGSGKEIVARAVHSRGPRAQNVFAPVNCAGLPETLLESELFGHVKGSFTGAYRDKPGKLETAHLGTAFLDEVGEMTLRMQGLLLRFLETGEIQKVGAEGSGRHLNVRVVAATNRDLREMVKQGTFREDLFYRLNVIHIVVPPLRERREIVTVAGPAIDVEHLPSDIRAHDRVALRPKRERRRTVADDLYQRMLDQRESFWTTVYPLFMDREITRANVREVIRRGLEEARGNYKIVARLFNMEPRDYKRFLNFLRKHDCQIPFKDYR